MYEVHVLPSRVSHKIHQHVFDRVFWPHHVRPSDEPNDKDCLLNIFFVDNEDDFDNSVLREVVNDPARAGVVIATHFTINKLRYIHANPSGQKMRNIDLLGAAMADDAIGRIVCVDAFVEDEIESCLRMLYYTLFIKHCGNARILPMRVKRVLHSQYGFHVMTNPSYDRDRFR